jgi:hypothetical protein
MEVLAMWDVILGGILVIGALSGRLVLIGTKSSLALGVLGALMIVWGIRKMKRGRP